MRKDIIYDKKLLSYSIVTLLILFSNSSPLGLIKQTSLGKFSFLVAVEIESSWDRLVVPGFHAEKDAPEHEQRHEADDDADDPFHAGRLSDAAAEVI